RQHVGKQRANNGAAERGMNCEGKKTVSENLPADQLRERTNRSKHKDIGHIEGLDGLRLSFDSGPGLLGLEDHVFCPLQYVGHGACLPSLRNRPRKICPLRDVTQQANPELSGFLWSRSLSRRLKAAHRRAIAP